MPTCDCSRLIDNHSIRLRRPFLPHQYRGALREEIPLNSDRQLRKTIDDLRELERKCFASRSRFAFYDYLAAVFELYVQLRRSNQAKPSARRIAKLFGLRKQNRTHPIRVIIDATSTADLKTRSRWTRALRYAWRERKTWRDLEIVPAGKWRACWVRQISLLQSTQREGIRVASSTGTPELVGLI